MALSPQRAKARFNSVKRDTRNRARNSHCYLQVDKDDGFTGYLVLDAFETDEQLEVRTIHFYMLPKMSFFCRLNFQLFFLLLFLISIQDRFFCSVRQIFFSTFQLNSFSSSSSNS